jgi:hypothetical protein
MNVLGYYGVFLGLQYQNSRQLSKGFDSGSYDESASVTIKIPLTVPYATNADEFQRVDGEFEHEGEIYRMVKQRFSQDTLFIVCVKDHAGKQISQALKDYVKTFADSPVDSKSQVKTVPSFIKDYIPVSNTFDASSEGWSSPVVYQSHTQIFIPSFCSSIVHPPERG